MANLNLQINARGTNVSAKRRDNNVVIDIDNTATEAATVAAGTATAAALAAATSVQQIGEQVEARADELFEIIPARTVTGDTDAQAGETLVIDTRGGTFAITLPDSGIVTLRMPESLNPVSATLDAGARAAPALSDFIGYAVQIYPLDADTIAIQSLGYIYEGEA